MSKTMDIQNPFDMTGRVAIVTGSSRGIGRAIAEQLAASGARVVITSRKVDACRLVADAINHRHGEERALSIASSLADKQSLAALVEATVTRWGRIDALVCNAASNPYYGPMSGITDEQFTKILNNNILANHWLAAMVTPDMQSRRDGAILIISSIGGLVGSPVIGAYNLSKAADMQLARNLAVELGPDNIRVNCIAPGLIRTDFSRALWENPGTMSRYQAMTPLGRVGEPGEIAGAALMLLSPAGRFITGQTIVIDGGATISGV
jgi:NAD(P)-dependent dehydrogenase (short-subunit alcohol dehydrogenase family)